MKESEIRPKELFAKYLDLSRRDSENFDNKSFSYMNCVCCDSDQTVYYLKKNGFTYNICNYCNSLMCNPRPCKDDLNNFYHHSKSSKYWFNRFLPKVEEARREKVFSKKADLLKKKLKILEIDFSNLCDVGAGSGIFLEELKRVFPTKSFAAIEPGKTSSEILIEKGIDVLNKKVEEAFEWYNKFDFVVSLEVLEHVHTPIDFISSLYKLLTPGGVCLVTTLGFEGFDIQILKEHSNSIFPPHHLNFPSLKGFEYLSKRVGFNMIEISTPGVLDTDIVLNSDYCPDFLRILQSRGTQALNGFQEFLVNNKMSSHVWLFAYK